jgi:hypothetical protein
VDRDATGLLCRTAAAARQLANTRRFNHRSVLVVRITDEEGQ